MINNFTRLLTLLTAAYVLYIIMHNGLNGKENIREGFEDKIADPLEYDPNDPNVFDQPFDESKIIDGNYPNTINLRKPIEYNSENIKKEPSYLGRPYRLDRKSILKKTEDDNKYLKKEQTNLENLNFLYPKSHSQTNFSGIHSHQKNVQIRTEPPNPRSNQNPWSIKTRQKN
jgi:flagellar basal body rod protein FlgC